MNRIAAWMSIAAVGVAVGVACGPRREDPVEQLEHRLAACTQTCEARYASTCDFEAMCESTGPAISPAPMNSTFSSLMSPNNSPESRTMAAAKLTVCMPISVPVRTSFATAKERWNIWDSVLPKAPAASAARTASFIWPKIWGSPSTMESSPLATRKAWRAATSFSRV